MTEGPGAVTTPKKGKSEKRRHNSLVRMDDDLCADARILASMLGTSMAELIGEIAGPVIKKRLADEMRKRLRDDPKDRGAK